MKSFGLAAVSGLYLSLVNAQLDSGKVTLRVKNGEDTSVRFRLTSQGPRFAYVDSGTEVDPSEIWEPEFQPENKVRLSAVRDGTCYYLNCPTTILSSPPCEAGPEPQDFEYMNLGRNKYGFQHIPTGQGLYQDGSKMSTNNEPRVVNTFGIFVVKSMNL